MNNRLKNYFAILMLFMLFAPQSVAAVETMSNISSASVAKKTTAAFSFDSVWFYREGIRVIPEISRRWLTVVFEPGDNSTSGGFGSTSDSPGFTSISSGSTGDGPGSTSYSIGSTSDSFIQEKAKAILLTHDRLTEYLYDPNLAENACFFRLRDGLKLEDISELINQLNQDNAVKYVQPAVVLNNKTYAFFNVFTMEWKTGTDASQREALLSAAHVVFDEKENHYTVDVTAMPFFKALNLLAEDIRVLKATPYLVEIKPSISTKLSLLMSGGNIGDSIPFTLTIIFSDRVSIDPSSLATLNLRPSNLQKDLFDCTFDPYDYAKAVTKSPIVITGRIKFYAPGEFTIPAVTLRYTCPSCADSTVRSLDTNPVLFKVSSIIPADQSGNWLIVPTDSSYPDYHPAVLHQQSLRYLWFTIIGFSGLILCAVWLLLLRRKAIAERDRPKERKKDELLAEQLRTLLHAAPPAPHWSYLGEIGTLLREFMVVHYGIDLKYQGGSGKQFMETIGAHVPGECVNSLHSIFTAIDNSVALESEHYQNIDLLQCEILKVVDLIAPNGAAQG
ncbi:MAG: hypothetical protein WCA04_01270 [Geobacteraceae bacterium]